MRILVVTDAWHPQVNGVVRTMSTVIGLLRAAGHAVEVIGPDRFRTIPCPTYPEIRLALRPGREIGRVLDEFRPDAIHVSTEGPLGIAARRIARRRGLRFTTAFHTRFAEYLEARTRLPARVSYWWLRRFHNAGAGTMVATASLGRELEGRGFARVLPWSRGVDCELFRPAPPGAADPYAGLARPIFASIGRVAVEKNLPAFLGLDLPGTKVVVGDGPARPALALRFPAATFLGLRTGAELSACFAGADVFVFPSLTDTFGLVMLEALACGTPVAAHPVTGPRDLLEGHAVGVLDADLGRAARAALALDRTACRPFAEARSWAHCARLFLGHLVPAHPGSALAPPR